MENLNVPCDELSGAEHDFLHFEKTRRFSSFLLFLQLIWKIPL